MMMRMRMLTVVRVNQSDDSFLKQKKKKQKNRKKHKTTNHDGSVLSQALTLPGQVPHSHQLKGWSKN